MPPLCGLSKGLCATLGPSLCTSQCPQQESWISPSLRRRCKASSSITRWVSCLPEGWVFCSSSEIMPWFLWLQMALSPSYRMDNGKMVKVRSSRNAHMAVTQYQVLSSTLSSALLELQPVTGEGAGVLQWEAAPFLLRSVLGPVLCSALLNS